MKVLALLLLLPGCLLLAGCPSYSVHPLYTGQDAVVQPAIEGSWNGSNSQDRAEIVFQKTDSTAYNMTVYHPDTKVKDSYEVHLVRLRGQLFMDIFADNQTINGENVEGLIGVIPTHLIAKVQISRDDLAYATLEDVEIKGLSAAPLDYLEMDHGPMLVTAPTDVLRRYISAHADGVFSEFQHLKRPAKASTPQ